MTKTGSFKAGLSSSLMKWITGRYYRSFLENNNLSVAGAIASGTLYAVPFMVPLPTTIDRMGIRATVGVNNGLVRFGLYADNNGKADGGALLADFGAVTMSGTGAQDVEVAASYTLLPHRVYWGVLLSDSGPTVRFSATTSPRIDAGDLSYDDQASIQRFSVAQAYGTLPLTCPTLTATASGGIGIKLRAA